MKVRIVTSEGTLLTERTARPGQNTMTIKLTEGQEVTVWGESGGRLHRALAHMDALKSGEIHFNAYDGLPCLSDGTPVTDEIMEGWGWRREGNGWAFG